MNSTIKIAAKVAEELNQVNRSCDFGRYKCVEGRSRDSNQLNDGEGGGDDYYYYYDDDDVTGTVTVYNVHVR
jgi:hypothetical protein